MTLTDFFQGNQEQENNKTLFDVTDVTTLEMNDLNEPPTIELIGSALNGPSPLILSPSLSSRNQLVNDSEIRINDIENRLAGIEAGLIGDIITRLATIDARLDALEARR